MTVMETVFVPFFEGSPLYFELNVVLGASTLW